MARYAAIAAWAAADQHPRRRRQAPEQLQQRDVPARRRASLMRLALQVFSTRA